MRLSVGRKLMEKVEVGKLMVSYVSYALSYER